MQQATAPPGVAAQPPGPGRLTLIGAGHVFDIRTAIEGAILALRPDVVFVELDRDRLQALLHRERGGSTPQAEGFLHRRLAKFQEQVAQMYGAEVGGEMLGAVAGARAVGARLVLVDGDAALMLRRARREMPLREKLRFVGEMARGALKGLRPGRGARAAIEAELTRYQEDPYAVLQELGSKFPTAHRILIAERDAAMATRIRAGLAGARHGVAVLGDGHLNGMQPQLADLHPQVYRLADVREGRLPRHWHATGSSCDIRFWHAHGP